MKSGDNDDASAVRPDLEVSGCSVGPTVWLHIHKQLELPHTLL